MKLRNFLMAVLVLIPTTVFAQGNAVQTAINHLQSTSGLLGLISGDVDDLAVTDAYASRRSNTTHVYIAQTLDGISVVGANYTVTVDNSGDVVYADGLFERAITRRVSTSSPGISASSAVASMMQEAGMPAGTFVITETQGGNDQATVLENDQIARLPVTARLVYRPAVDQFEDPDSDLILAWEILLYERDREHYWYANVDATTGDVLFLHDQVAHDIWGPAIADPQSAHAGSDDDVAGNVARMIPTVGGPEYRAFALPVESPKHASPPLPLDGRTLEADPADATASPFGWHDTNGAAGAEFTDTRGNNVDAHKGAARPDCGAGLSCDFAADFSLGPLSWVPAATVNNFYLSNIIHDFTYHYGFDEAAGNFQENNYGNGGSGSDGVDSNVQFPGNCNATFGTPPDGSNPTMRMYICTAANPDADSDMDTGVLFHEYGHGISNRLTGGPGTTSCLNNSEQMGEGWSDFMGILPTIEPGDAGPDVRGVGTYFLGQATTGPGIRPQPYSTNPAVNNAEHADICGQAIPHGVGWVWASILWEVTWELIDAYGYDPDIYDASSTAGNNVMLQLVIEGMKLQPCSPGFVSGRDAILQADVNLYGGIHLFELWEAFARRGLGDGASQGSTGSTCDNTNSFVNPIPVELVGFSATVDGSDVVLNWATASETNNAGFDVQMRSDDNSFESLGFADGHGTTTEAQSYAYRVADLEPGTYTFRLKQLDFDGQFEYTFEVEATVGVVGTYELSDVYPNPFNPQAQFNLAIGTDQSVTIAVYDVMGRQVATIYEGQLASGEAHQFTIDGSSLASGAYLVRISGEHFSDTRRITLLK